MDYFLDEFMIYDGIIGMQSKVRGGTLMKELQHQGACPSTE